MSEYLNKYRHSKKERYIQEHGGKCSCCGITNKEFLRFSKKQNIILCANCFHGIQVFQQCPHKWLHPTKEQFENLLSNLIKNIKEK